MVLLNQRVSSGGVGLSDIKRDKLTTGSLAALSAVLFHNYGHSE